ncbi:MAG TPA: alpha/beta hydrolase [Chitinophagaceae bacterium]
MQEKKLNGNYYRVLGEGEAVMLVHGFGEDGRIWKNQENLFEGYKLVIPDLPGSGQSPVAEDMSMEGLAKVLKDIADAEKLDKFIMIGHSMGGYITLAFAEHYQHRLHGFGLFHSSAYADNEEKKATRRKGIEFIQTNGAAAFLKTTITNLYSPVSKEKKPELIEEQINMTKGQTEAALVAYYESMINRPDRTELLKSTELPVMFLLGKHDAAVPFEDGLKQSHIPKISHVEILEDSGHMGMVEEIEKSNKMLLSFVDYCISQKRI